jgi:hypothetical protein
VRQAVPFLLAALGTVTLAVDRGGYRAVSWGWAGLAFAWVAAAGLVLRPRATRYELAFVGGLAAFTGWTALSVAWTSSQTQTVLQVERALVYVLGAAAVVAVVRSDSYRALLWGVWVGAAAVCAYGLLTRLAPNRLGFVDGLANNRLEAPIGYWNGLGVFAAMAMVLAFGLASHGRPRIGRALCAASLPFFVATLYLTFSRGAWIALAAALVAAVLLSTRRLELLASLVVQSPPALASVWLVHHERGLYAAGDPVRDGHRALLILPVFAVAAAVAVVAAAAVAGTVAHYGGPVGALKHAKHSMLADEPAADLNARLFSLSNDNRLRQWHVAVDEWRAHRLLGGGAGTYAEYWMAAGPNQTQLTNVHNLYLETLAELGPFGLALLVVALAIPLVCAVAARRRSLVPAACAAYVAWLVHVAYDWDWQLTGVTIVAFFCAGAVVVATRDRTAPPRGAVAMLVALVLAAGALSVVGLAGNRALGRSGADLAKGDLVGALAADRDARRWAPWSAQPWQLLGQIRTVTGDAAQARAAFHKAVAKEPRNWELWLGLAASSSGRERDRALARLRALSPRVGAQAGGASR